ncbi:hypothetical protein BOX07_gp18 [Pseudoalteromonas phage PH1]|uniref:hypothetical protein n=1 Tax=Pseudoalteromonas phage PH1 TaxID=1874540 RepID=UPI0008197D23|nr:hypothetical protein BOX07_gp18 [Pseudoalteromonas phage PH1]ANY29529.1 hypothetical protein [Pseudoalteromonas phage PH1]
MRKRKLVTRPVLFNLYKHNSMGVPLTKLVASGDYDISRPALASLLRALESEQSTTVSASLFPVWLDENGPTVQEQPDNFIYLGKFPHGEWYEVN